MRFMVKMEKVLNYNILNISNNTIYDIWNMIKYSFFFTHFFVGHFIKKNTKILL